MLPELGLLSLCFAAVMAVLLCVVPLWGFYQKQPHFLRMSHTLSYLYALFVTIF